MPTLKANIAGVWTAVGSPVGDFVAKPGDTMTGMLTMTTVPEKIRLVGGGSHITFYDNAGTTRLGYSLFDDSAANGWMMVSEISGRPINIQTVAGELRLGPGGKQTKVEISGSLMTGAGTARIYAGGGFALDAYYGSVNQPVGGLFFDWNANGGCIFPAATNTFDIAVSGSPVHFRVSKNRLQVPGGFLMGSDHPAAGFAGKHLIWPGGFDGAGDFYLMGDVAAGNTIVNGRSNVYVQIGNANCFVFNTQAAGNKRQLQAFNGRFWSQDYVPNSVNWADAALVVDSASYLNAAMSLRGGVSAIITRCMQGNGNVLGVVSMDHGVFVPVYASAFTVQSSTMVKRDVRTLGRERDWISIAAPLDDEVGAVDVMQLRPVVFRPIKQTVDRIIDDDSEQGWHTEIAPWDDPESRQARRERLGLIAEEVAEVLPSAVAHNTDGSIFGIDYAQVTVALLEHLQRLTDEVSTLRYRIIEMEGTP